MFLKLLFINNDNSLFDRIRNVLKANSPDIEIHSSNKLPEILDKINQIKPQIILFDFDQFCNKEECLKLIEDLKNNANIPVIVISSANDLDSSYNAGAINYIQKPFLDTTFISNLKSAIKLLNIHNSIKIKEKEIEEKNQRIQFQIENELTQREIIIRKNKEIMADIRYASRIQQAILPSIELIQNNFKEYFILHQPKSHVSGDFYWVSFQENKKIIAVGDCTGHGLSGALMHMLGSVYLNEVVTKEAYRDAGDILNRLRDHIMKSLNQTGEMGEAQDGLDIALCIIDYQNKTLQFAGANNPLYIVKNNDLIETKGDRMPVGIHINFNKPFTNHILKIENGDQLYLFSDGYADQFGGPKGKKFRYKQFKDLLIEISHEPMNIQKEILNNVHDKWRGNLDQIDDILVFGLKIK